MLKLNTDISSRINRSMVLSLIHRTPMISRVQIAEVTGLDRSAITHILKEFLAKGLVEEVEEGKASAKGGRRPVQLRIRYDVYTIIAVDIAVKQFVVTITDLAGTMLKSYYFPIKPRENLLDILIGHLEEVRDAAKDLFKKACCLSISCPGIVDHENGRILLNDFHNWRHINLREPLFEAFGKPVFVANDANAYAMAEWITREKQGERLDSILFLMIRGGRIGSELPFGIGGSMIVQGKILHGASNCSGEISRPLSEAITAILRERHLRYEAITPMVTAGVSPLTLMLTAVERGEREDTELMVAISDLLSKYLADIAAFIDPQLVIVSILPPDHTEPFLEALERSFRNLYSKSAYGRTEFGRGSVYGEDALSGAVAQALEKIFVRDRSQPSLLFA